MSQHTQLLADLDYLESEGMTTQQLRSLHHWAGRPDAERRVTFNSLRTYFKRELEMEANNSLLAARLHFVADAHKRDLSALVEGAIRALPDGAADAI
jgi:hypothetical protein